MTPVDIVTCEYGGHVRPKGGVCLTCDYAYRQRLLPQFDVARVNERLTPRPRPLAPHEKRALADVARIYRGGRDSSPSQRGLGVGCGRCGRLGPRLAKGLCWKCQRDARTPLRPRLWGA